MPWARSSVLVVPWARSSVLVVPWARLSVLVVPWEHGLQASTPLHRDTDSHQRMEYSARREYFAQGLAQEPVLA